MLNVFYLILAIIALITSLVIKKLEVGYKLQPFDKKKPREKNVVVFFRGVDQIKYN